MDGGTKRNIIQIKHVKTRKKCLQMGIAKQGLYAYINLYKLKLQQCLAHYGHWIVFSKFKLNHHEHRILFNYTRYKQQKM